MVGSKRIGQIELIVAGVQWTLFTPFFDRERERESQLIICILHRKQSVMSTDITG